ncbi:MAG: MerR family transcriptional regulator [Oscillospiraceae bacterium]|nr:MerR family transcriptional regulator [Oscillospiraceae bacterium]
MNEETLLSIKEFSDFTGVNQSTLRYYDEIGLLPAASRGENNYRYYVPFQIIKLNYINVLIDLGVPLSAIKDMDLNRTPESVIRLLNQQEDKLNAKLNDLRTAYSIIHTYRKNILQGLAAHDGLIRVEELPDTRFVLGHINDFDFKNHITFYEEFIRFCKDADEQRINLRYPIGGYHNDIASFLKYSNRPDRYFSLDPLGNKIRPQGSYLVGYKQGYYGEFGNIAQQMNVYIKEHDLVCKGPVYVLYLLDEISITEPGHYLARISVSVSPRSKTKRVKV